MSAFVFPSYHFPQSPQQLLFSKPAGALYVTPHRFAMVRSSPCPTSRNMHANPTPPSPPLSTPPSPPRIVRKRTLPRPPRLNLGSIEEERGLSEYDCGYLDLGTESPASASTPNLAENAAVIEQWAAGGTAASRVPARRKSFRSSSFNKDRDRPAGLKKDAVDRDCGICFEYAVVPCRTLCCGKIFCTEHLAAWLHGPNAEGHCPNCENACSLEGGTLSLAPPARLPASQAPSSKRNTLTPAKPATFPSSPLTSVQTHCNDTLSDSRDRSHPHASSEPTPPVPEGSSSTSPSLMHLTEVDLSAPSSMSSSATGSSTTASVEEEQKSQGVYHHTFHRQPTTSSMNLSTTPFSSSWGAHGLTSNPKLKSSYLLGHDDETADSSSRSTPSAVQWDDSDLYSQALFPYALAAISPMWDGVLASYPVYWTRVLLLVDSRPTSLEDAQVYLERSKNLPIGIAICRREKTHPNDDAQEKALVASFMELLQPEMESRCTSVHVDDHASSSLPS
ncbi:hypothetical protein B0H34DRAFT_797275 [Crassisporium funariophilum]|nr:hypothetical protein B0H34DRAFT_797275 [Crassisporium funariophilum]